MSSSVVTSSTEKNDELHRRCNTQQAGCRRRCGGVLDSMPGSSCDPGYGTQAAGAARWRVVVHGAAIPRAGLLGFPVRGEREDKQQLVCDIAKNGIATMGPSLLCLARAKLGCLLFKSVGSIEPSLIAMW